MQDDRRTPDDEERLPEDLQDEGRTLAKDERPALEELPPGKPDDNQHGG